ncbi:glucose 1-dehydrogenase [Paenibacillus sp.]|uniref:SDR family NAD(P)-dependent oxidoreductase n=1 Tax=Paenibacillus sp. TaxID=58172 RepID=UPI002D6FBF7D|nr:glucose 1-dehydrogenase [Paenibacillus sp.]HZG56182.1 glucose 1-dehydrogenase [Paenibacillus sp.]
MVMLSGKTAVVTGGSRGIGSGIALELARAGAAVAVNYQGNAEAASRVVASIRAAGGRAIAVQADVGRPEQVARMMERVGAELGGIDIVVNNAGICPFRDVFDIDMDVWEETIRTNLTGVFVCSQAGARLMKERGAGGAIVNISTITSYRGGAEQVHYAASKGGVNALTASMANALGVYGIRVNAILCGGVVTDINRDRVPEALRTPKATTDSLPIGRLGDPEDLGKAVVFLASPQSEWITGVQLAVDGGFMVSEGKYAHRKR